VVLLGGEAIQIGDWGATRIMPGRSGTVRKEYEIGDIESLQLRPHLHAAAILPLDRAFGVRRHHPARQKLDEVDLPLPRSDSSRGNRAKMLHDRGVLPTQRADSLVQAVPPGEDRGFGPRLPREEATVSLSAAPSRDPATYRRPR
jgi:hypothetical protein